MNDPFEQLRNQFNQPQAPPIKKKTNYWLPLLMVVITFVTTLISGTHWILGFGTHEITELSVGFAYSLSILFVLGCHEFGHYFASKAHGVHTTLPFFIPFPPIPGFINFGTLGAVIKTKQPITTKKALFDVGVAGPIAGFIASVGVLIYGFTHLPGEEYILSIHPDYFSSSYGQDTLNLMFGDSILFALLREIFTNPATDFIPPMSEIYHYPYLTVGWFGLFVTAMNMVPVGQLDGGHIIFAMFGEKKHQTIASISMLALIFLGLIDVVALITGAEIGFGWTGWLFWALLLYFVIKVKHPPVADDTPLDSKRMLIGYFSIFILIVSFTPSPFIIHLN